MMMSDSFCVVPAAFKRKNRQQNEQEKMQAEAEPKEKNKKKQNKKAKQKIKTKQADTMNILTPNEMLHYGLYVLGLPFCNDKEKKKKYESQFHKNYGVHTVVAAAIWYDLTSSCLSQSEISFGGLKFFFMAIYFLWQYPKNAVTFGQRFGVCKDYAGGEYLWGWIRKIAGLEAKKIKWLDCFDDPHAPAFILSVDGTDFRCWERKHPTLPRDPSTMSHKFNHGAKKVEIGIATYSSQVCWLSDPSDGARHDLTIFRDGLKQKIAPGKKVNCDRGYKTSQPDETMLAPPNGLDGPELQNFKSRGRLRHETFNARLKKFGILDQTFRHGEEKHKLAIVSVVVICQYTMENGSPLYDV